MASVVDTIQSTLGLTTKPTEPIELYVHNGPGPDPYKIAMLCEELSIPYNIHPLDFGDGPNGIKSAKFISINPNGRVPAIVDPNSNHHVVWESAAILVYLQTKYGGVQPSPEKISEVMQWLSLQVSSFGPQKGLYYWFVMFHEKETGEKPGEQTVKKFYDEMHRLYRLLEEQLERQQEEKGSVWLVGDEYSIADIAFYAWLHKNSYETTDYEKEYPRLNRYIDRIAAREATKRAYEKLPTTVAVYPKDGSEVPTQE